MSDSGEYEINTLDKYFNNLFHDQIEFGLSDEEVSEIQKGIEYLVYLLTDAIDKDVTQLKKDISVQFMDKYPEHRFICEGNSNGAKILKVGSYYENTKNGYPDEFDFIYVLSTFAVDEYKTTELFWRENYLILNPFHDAIKEFLRCRQIEIPNVRFVTEKGDMISFHGYDRTEGPSSKLKFSYWNCYTDEIKYIYVDIVPALEIIDQHIGSRIREVCHLKDFAREVIAKGSYLITKEVSFTTTEVHFIRYILSEKHRKAYRILKYLFNGNRNGNILPSSDTCYRGITSYMIKVAMIHHHCKCNHHGHNLSECLIKVLEDLQHFCIHNMDVERNNQLRKLNGGQFNLNPNVAMQTNHHLRKLQMKLELMKILNFQLKIRPVAIQILTDTENRSSKGKRIPIKSLESSFYSHSVSSKTSSSKSDDECVYDLENKIVWEIKSVIKYDDNAQVFIESYRISREYLNRHDNESHLNHGFFEAPENEDSPLESPHYSHSVSSQTICSKSDDEWVYDSESMPVWEMKCANKYDDDAQGKFERCWVSRENLNRHDNESDLFFEVPENENSTLEYPLYSHAVSNLTICSKSNDEWVYDSETMPFWEMKCANKYDDDAQGKFEMNRLSRENLNRQDNESDLNPRLFEAPENEDSPLESPLYSHSVSSQTICSKSVDEWVYDSESMPVRGMKCENKYDDDAQGKFEMYRLSRENLNRHDNESNLNPRFFEAPENEDSTLESPLYSHSVSSQTICSKSDDEWVYDSESMPVRGMKCENKYDDDAQGKFEMYRLSRENLNRHDNESNLNPRFFEAPENEDSTLESPHYSYAVSSLTTCSKSDDECVYDSESMPVWEMKSANKYDDDAQGKFERCLVSRENLNRQDNESDLNPRFFEAPENEDSTLERPLYSHAVSNLTICSKSDDEWVYDSESMPVWETKCANKYDDDAQGKFEMYRLSRENLNRHDNESNLNPRFFEAPENEYSTLESPLYSHAASSLTTCSKSNDEWVYDSVSMTGWERKCVNKYDDDAQGKFERCLVSRENLNRQDNESDLHPVRKIKCVNKYVDNAQFDTKRYIPIIKVVQDSQMMPFGASGMPQRKLVSQVPYNTEFYQRSDEQYCFEKQCENEPSMSDTGNTIELNHDLPYKIRCLERMRSGMPNERNNVQTRREKDKQDITSTWTHPCDSEKHESKTNCCNCVLL